MQRHRLAKKRDESEVRTSLKKSRTHRTVTPWRKTRYWFLVATGAVILTLLMSVAGTQHALAQVGGSEWQATYWNNLTLTGVPALRRTEAEISYVWGDSSPSPGIVSVDRFSARWTTTIDVPEGRYRFTVTADDGVRLWVNGAPIIDQWRVQAATTYQAEIQLPGGPVPIRMEYFENTGGAVAQLSWTRVARAGTISSGLWQADYFGNQTLNGPPILERREVAIDNDWGSGSPEPGIVPIDGFSARWQRALNLTPGQYRFVVTVDDGVRLWVDQNLVIDQWIEQPATTYAAVVNLSGGVVPVRMEYFEDRLDAVARLQWSKIAETSDRPPATGAPLNTWLGEYFDNALLEGPVALTRYDRQIDFNWGAGSPAPTRVPADRFSAIWTRTLDLAPGQYRFTASFDDGMRVWVDGQLILDEWRVQPIFTQSALVEVAGGATPVRVEYFENTGGAAARLTWRRVGIASPPAVLPTEPTGQVIAGRLNVRIGPGIDYEPFDVLINGQTVEMLGRNAAGTWLQIRMPDGQIGWVSRTYIGSSTSLAMLPVLQ